MAGVQTQGLMDVLLPEGILKVVGWCYRLGHNKRERTSLVIMDFTSVFCIHT